MNDPHPRNLLGLQSQDSVVLSAIAATYAGAIVYGVVYNDLMLALVLGALLLGAAWLLARGGRAESPASWACRSWAWSWWAC